MGLRVWNKADFYIRRGDRKRLRRLMNKRPQLLNPTGSLLLFTAIWCRPSLVRWLLDCGVSPDCRDAPGANTPLMQASADGDIALVNLLLDFGACIETVNDSNERALGFACTWLQPDAVRLLIDRGADVNTPEDADKTYLDWAIIGEHNAIADLLRSNGALRFSELPRGGG